MQCTFRNADCTILLEAEPGDLFAPLGPDLVECVCALHHSSAPAAPRWMNPDTPVDVIVIACRVGPGEPEYYPTGHCAQLSGAAPIAYLEQVEPLALRPRRSAGDARVSGDGSDEPLPPYAGEQVYIRNSRAAKALAAEFLSQI